MAKHKQLDLHPNLCRAKITSPADRKKLLYAAQLGGETARTNVFQNFFHLQIKNEADTHFEFTI